MILQTLENGSVGPFAGKVAHFVYPRLPSFGDVFHNFPSIPKCFPRCHIFTSVSLCGVLTAPPFRSRRLIAKRVRVQPGPERVAISEVMMPRLIGTIEAFAIPLACKRMPSRTVRQHDRPALAHVCGVLALVEDL
jgi:hypothetical protein